MKGSLISAQTPVVIQTIGVGDDFSHRVRVTLIDDLDQAAVRFTSSQGGEPLRDLLRRARPGEEVIVASYSLFPAASPFREFGPVYISGVEGKSAWAGDIFASDYFGDELVLRAYSRGHWIQQAQRVSKGGAQEVINRWLSEDNGILFVDARFPVYGCYGCRFSRLAGGKPEDL